MLTLQVAQRKKAKLKLGLSAPSGGGKTFGALLIAFGLIKEKYPKMSDSEIWSKIAIIDSENGSGQLYVGTDVGGIRIGSYNTILLEPPFEADKYSQGIKLCKESGMEVCIIDSTTHLWAGQGGLLEQQANVAKRTGNSYTAWRDVTPQHNRFIDTMLQTDIHIIATMRSKTEYVQEKNPDTGKTTVRKVGLNPIQKEGMEFEFTAFMEIDADHIAFGSKDRSGVVDQKYQKITPELGKEFMRWLESGLDEKTSATVIGSNKSDQEKQKELDIVLSEIISSCKYLGGSKNEKLMVLVKKYEPSGNPNNIKDMSIAEKLSGELDIMVSEKDNETKKEDIQDKEKGE